jgi:hypothetical protein
VRKLKVILLEIVVKLYEAHLSMTKTTSTACGIHSSVSQLTVVGGTHPSAPPKHHSLLFSLPSSIAVELRAQAHSPTVTASLWPNHHIHEMRTKVLLLFPTIGSAIPVLSDEIERMFRKSFR